MVSQTANDKRRRILDAAARIFAQHGFFHARVTDIAKEAGVADGTIYLYFKSKDDLLISLFEDRMDDIIATFRGGLGEGLTAGQKLHRFIELHLRLVEEEPALAKVLTVELRQSSKFMRDYQALKFGEYLDLLSDILDEGRASGQFRATIDPRILKRVIFGALDEVSLVWSSRLQQRRERYELADAATEIWNLCTGGILSTAHSTNTDISRGETA